MLEQQETAPTLERQQRFRWRRFPTVEHETDLEMMLLLPK